jgi:hypothetical protein
MPPAFGTEIPLRHCCSLRLIGFALDRLPSAAAQDALLRVSHADCDVHDTDNGGSMSGNQIGPIRVMVEDDGEPYPYLYRHFHNM